MSVVRKVNQKKESGGGGHLAAKNLLQVELSWKPPPCHILKSDISFVSGRRSDLMKKKIVRIVCV